jgi:hypothetical protein
MALPRSIAAMSDALPFLRAADLRRLAGEAASPQPCASCAAIAFAGWGSIPGSFDRKALRRIGTLRPPGTDEPTLQEHHPAGTNAWSADAPIAPAYFPYNRCDVWQCTECPRTFLRYTEYGGYYEEERIRPVSAALVDEAG